MLSENIRLKVAAIKLILTAELLLTDLSTDASRYLKQKKLNCEHVIQTVSELIVLHEERDRHLEINETEADIPLIFRNWERLLNNETGGIPKYDAIVYNLLMAIVTDIDRHRRLQRELESRPGNRSAPKWLRDSHQTGQMMLKMEAEAWARMRESDIPGEKIAAMDEITKVRDVKEKEKKRKQDYAHLYKLYSSERARQTATKNGEEQADPGYTAWSTYVLGPPHIDVPLLKSILAKNAHLPLAKIDIREALKAPGDPNASADMLTKSQERQRRKKANREAKLKAQETADGDVCEGVEELDLKDKEEKEGTEKEEEETADDEWEDVEEEDGVEKKKKKRKRNKKKKANKEKKEEDEEKSVDEQEKRAKKIDSGGSFSVELEPFRMGQNGFVFFQPSASN